MCLPKGTSWAASLFPDKNEQYWLGKSKPKQAFRLTQNTFNKLLQFLKLKFSDRLMPSDKRNLITAKATGLNFLEFSWAV